MQFTQQETQLAQREHAVFNEMRDAVKAKGLHKRGVLATKPTTAAA